jgi:two-component system, NtrC family, response regulator AtoC
VQGRILIVDTEPELWSDTRRALLDARCEVTCTAAPGDARELAATRYDLVICERALVARLARRVAVNAIAVAMRAPFAPIAHGIDEVMARPADPSAVLLALRRARVRSEQARRIELLERQLARSAGERPIVAASAAMIELLEQIERIAPTRAPLLVIGEPGSGREGAARAVHAQSGQRGGPFVAIECTRDAESALERLADAEAGTLYLDGLEALPLAVQLQLDAALRDAHVRPIAASARELDEPLRRGSLCKELYERFSGARLRVPALRERREDLPLLVDHLVARAAAQRGRPCGVTADALALLVAYPWPGNFRELAAVLERAVTLARQHAITPRELPDDLAHPREPELTDEFALKPARRAFETDLIRRALRATGGNRTRAARLLGISHRALLYRLKELGNGD